MFIKVIRGQRSAKKRSVFSDSKANPICKYCKSHDVFWRDTEFGWKMMNNDRTPHRCWDKDEE